MNLNKTFAVLCLSLLLSNFLSAKEYRVSNAGELVKAVKSANAGYRILLKKADMSLMPPLSLKGTAAPLP